MIDAPPPPPPTVLVVSETAGYRHASIPAQHRFLRALPGLRIVVLDRMAQLTAARLRGARAVVLASTSGDPAFSSAALRGLTAFVRRGGGLVGTHAATDTFRERPAFVRLFGAAFDRHGPIERRRVVVTGRAFTATRGVPRAFTRVDEWYAFRTDPRAAGARVVLALDRPGGPPMAWWRRECRGRVFYSAMGHTVASWTEPRHRGIVARGLRWAAGA